MKHETLHVIDADASDSSHAPTRETVQVEQRYDDAPAANLDEWGYPVPGFVNALLDKLGKDVQVEDAGLIDHIEPSGDIDDGGLFVFPDESLLFLGSDPTAKDAIPWFAFTIEPSEPVPAPATAQDALDLLKPPEVRDVLAEDGWLPNRHGEWWLLPSKQVPGGAVYKPGVGSRPYGPSPLGNHVPREYAFTAPDAEFLAAFREHVTSAPASIESVPEAIEWSWRQVQKSDPPDDAPNWADIRAWAGDVLVRKTIRHRDDDHYVENVGDRWHEAATHGIEVYTADSVATDIHLDYYGR